MHLFERLFALLMLVCCLPALLLAAVGIVISSRGPILYCAQRSGKKGRVFQLYKLRTMHVAQGARITSNQDARIFAWGALLRKTKIDELPQLWNIINGTMRFVGPRPEDASIVSQYYTPWHHRLLCVEPGLTSPGTLLYMSVFEHALTTHSAEKEYINQVLFAKTEADLSYLEHRTHRTDLKVIQETAKMILGV